MRDRETEVVGEEGGYAYVFRPSPSRDHRTLLLLHGTGGDERSLLGIGEQALPGASLLGLRGRVLEDGKARFFRRFALGVLDVDDLVRRAHEVAQAVRAVLSRRTGTAGPVVALGYSNGANLAVGLLLLEPGLLQGVLLLRPMAALTPAALPDLARIPVLVSGGRGDPYVPEEDPPRLFELLRQAGAEVTLWWQESGHRFNAGEVAGLSEWLRGVFPAASGGR